MITIKSPEEIELMRKAGEIVALTHKMLKSRIKPGVTTKELDKLAEEFIKSQGARPSFKNYQGFPASICVSVNDQVVHGIPGDYVLKEGDIVSIDIGAEYQGYHGDSAWTYPVGEISFEKRKLLEITEECLYKGLEMVFPDNYTGDIANAIQTYAESNGFSVVRELVGHGIGKRMHEDPPIPNYGNPKTGIKLKAGMTIAIEPMINAGSKEIMLLDDNWTIVTRDGKPSAHFEHTVLISENGYEILTKESETSGK